MAIERISCASVPQDIILNVSLTAVTMLWNVADTLARSKGVTKPASDPSTQGMQYHSETSLTTLPDLASQHCAV